MKARCYSSLDTHSQNRTFRAPLLRNFVLFMNGRPLRPADLSNFYASMKFVQILQDAWTVRVQIFLKIGKFPIAKEKNIMYS